MFVISFDVRDRPVSIARVYSEPTLFDEPTRAVMNVTQSPAALVISKLLPADSGLYKCRADFRRSPTKHALWNLTVIGQCQTGSHSVKNYKQEKKIFLSSKKCKKVSILYIF